MCTHTYVCTTSFLFPLKVLSVVLFSSVWSGASQHCGCMHDASITLPVMSVSWYIMSSSLVVWVQPAVCTIEAPLLQLCSTGSGKESRPIFSDSIVHTLCEDFQTNWLMPRNRSRHMLLPQDRKLATNHIQEVCGAPKSPHTLRKCSYLLQRLE